METFDECPVCHKVRIGTEIEREHGNNYMRGKVTRIHRLSNTATMLSIRTNNGLLTDWYCPCSVPEMFSEIKRRIVKQQLDLFGDQPMNQCPRCGLRLGTTIETINWELDKSTGRVIEIFRRSDGGVRLKLSNGQTIMCLCSELSCWEKRIIEGKLQLF